LFQHIEKLRYFVNDEGTSTNQYFFPQQASDFFNTIGHEEWFPMLRLGGRSTLREETFAGRCGNEKDAPQADRHTLAIGLPHPTETRL